MRTALRVKFPDHQGRYREFSRFQGPENYFAAGKASRSLWFLSKFPTQQIREFQNVIRELFAGSGNLLEITGTTARSLFIHRQHSSVKGTHGVNVERGADGFFSRWILPQVIELTMLQKNFAPFRERTAGAKASLDRFEHSLRRLGPSPRPGEVEPMNQSRATIEYHGGGDARDCCDACPDRSDDGRMPTGTAATALATDDNE
jgi:hypothetical protein